MSGRTNPRFPRTAGSVVDDRIMIEREKIRHRRPDDMRVHDGDDASFSEDPDPSQYHAEDDEEILSPLSDQEDQWSEEEEDASGEEQSWDDDADGEWVFDDPGPDAPARDDDSGITWGGDEDIQIEAPQASHDAPAYDDEDRFAPEVELAGKRDVRPRPPKPVPAKARHEQPGSDRRPGQRAGRMSAGPHQLDVELDSAPPQARPTLVQRAQGRFARTQATIETTSETAAPLQNRGRTSRQEARSAASRRRQARPATALPPRQQRSRRGRTFLMLVLLALLSTGGWFAYQRGEELSFQGLMNGVIETLGLPGSSRTAEDTSFGSTIPPAETAADPSGNADGGSILDIFTSGAEDGISTEEIAPLAPGRDSSSDGTSGAGTNGAPIPKFKPRDGSEAAGTIGVPRSITVQPGVSSSGSDASAELAIPEFKPRDGRPETTGSPGTVGVQPEEGNEPSALQQILNFLASD